MEHFIHSFKCLCLQQDKTLFQTKEIKNGSALIYLKSRDIHQSHSLMLCVNHFSRQSLLWIKILSYNTLKLFNRQGYFVLEYCVTKLKSRGGLEHLAGTQSNVCSLFIYLFCSSLQVVISPFNTLSSSHIHC